jgi:Fe-S-cluster-containing dehydrogenase component
MFFMRTDKVVVFAREGEMGPHRAAWSCPYAALQFLSTVETRICYARLARALPETHSGRVVKLAAAVYRATGQMADDQSPWT